MERRSCVPISVLVVEDDALIRMDTIDALADAGFSVHEAKTADEAIELLERHKEIRFLFTDVEMPGSMDGLKLAHYVRGRWPPVKIIVTSGRMSLGDDDMPTGSFFFDKPYLHENLTRKLRQWSDEAA